VNLAIPLDPQSEALDAAPEYLASAKMRSLAGPLSAPMDCDVVIVASRPGPRRDFGISAPQPPGVLSSDRANCKEKEARD
jgi:hypothetical protein